MDSAGKKDGRRSVTLGNLAIASVLVALLAAFYLWSSHEPERLSFRQTTSDYYALQVHGWAKGSLAMDVEPHPDLRVEYPNRIVGNAPYLLDASYYQGKYYLYFGPVPALLVLFPYYLITGADLPEAFTASLFTTAGLALSIIWLHLLATEVLRVQPKPWAFGLSVLALGLANVAPATLVRPLFYEIAVASGYAFTQASLIAATLAVLRPQRAGRWLFCASLFAGLAMGSRPNLVVGAAFLLPFIAFAAWRQGARTGRRLIMVFGAAGLPVTLIVGALLGYNHARFDRWLEFGNNLQLGANPHGFGFTLANFWHNLQVYYLTIPSLDWYFPFFAPGPEPVRPKGYFGIEEAHGQIVLLPVMLLAISLVRWRALLMLRWSAGTWIAAGAVGAGILNFALVAASGVRTNRYMMDFQPTMIVLAGLAFHAGLASQSIRRKLVGRLIGLGLAIAALYNVLISFQAGQRFQLLDPAGYSAVERTVNRAISPLFAHFGPDPGEQRWSITFPSSTTHRIEPIFVAGSITGHDALYIEFQTLGQARFLFEHTPHGIVPGPIFTYQPGQTAELGVRIGSLFPPLFHPWYADLSPVLQQQLRREIRLTLDGQPVFLGRAVTYPATLANGTIGSRGIGLRGEPGFSGEIRPGPGPGRTTASARNERSGEFVVTLPGGLVGHREPLLVYGSEVTRMGDAIFIEYLDTTTIRFGYDSSGELAFSQPVAITSNEPLKIAYHHEPSTPDGSQQGSIRVWVNDALAWAAPLWSRPIADPVWLPFCNPAFSASCRQLFTGVIHSESINEPSSVPDSSDIVLPRGTIQTMGLGTEVPTALVTWTQPNGARARLELQADNAGNLTLRLRDPLRTSETAVVPQQLSESDLRVVRTDRDVAVFLSREPILRHGSAFFADQAPQAWLEARSASFTSSRAVGNDLRSSQEPPAGPVVLELLLPQDRLGIGEPLVVAGVPGKADGVYVRYTSDQTIVFGFDHWGGGGGESRPIAVDFSQLQTVRIDFDSLRPTGAEVPGFIRVHLNEELVWSQAVPSHPYQAGTTVYGANAIGLSTAEPRFTGAILSVRSAGH